MLAVAWSTLSAGAATLNDFMAGYFPFGVCSFPRSPEEKVRVFGHGSSLRGFLVETVEGLSFIEGRVRLTENGNLAIRRLSTMGGDATLLAEKIVAMTGTPIPQLGRFGTHATIDFFRGYRPFRPALFPQESAAIAKEFPEESLRALLLKKEFEQDVLEGWIVASPEGNILFRGPASGNKTIELNPTDISLYTGIVLPKLGSRGEGSDGGEDRGARKSCFRLVTGEGWFWNR